MGIVRGVDRLLVAAARHRDESQRNDEAKDYSPDRHWSVSKSEGASSSPVVGLSNHGGPGTL